MRNDHQVDVSHFVLSHKELVSGKNSLCQRTRIGSCPVYIQTEKVFYHVHLLKVRI